MEAIFDCTEIAQAIANTHSETHFKSENKSFKKVDEKWHKLKSVGVNEALTAQTASAAHCAE